MGPVTGSVGSPAWTRDHWRRPENPRISSLRGLGSFLHSRGVLPGRLGCPQPGVTILPDLIERLGTKYPGFCCERQAHGRVSAVDIRKYAL